MCSSFPGFDGSRVIDTDCPIVLDNPASALGILPLQGVASQRLIRSAWPDEPPKIRLATCGAPYSLGASRALSADSFQLKISRAARLATFQSVAPSVAVE